MISLGRGLRVSLAIDELDLDQARRESAEQGYENQTQEDAAVLKSSVHRLVFEEATALGSEGRIFSETPGGMGRRSVPKSSSVLRMAKRFRI